MRGFQFKIIITVFFTLHAVRERRLQRQIMTSKAEVDPRAVRVKWLIRGSNCMRRPFVNLFSRLYIHKYIQ